MHWKREDGEGMRTGKNKRKEMQSKKEACTYQKHIHYDF